jgi:hypothetical protein
MKIAAVTSFLLLPSMGVAFAPAVRSLGVVVVSANHSGTGNGRNSAKIPGTRASRCVVRKLCYFIDSSLWISRYLETSIPQILTGYKLCVDRNWLFFCTSHGKLHFHDSRIQRAVGFR